ncbi:MAG: hypothetical protein V1694_12600 [Candidatus Eisenbacteria bacterium]
MSLKEDLRVFARLPRGVDVILWLCLAFVVGFSRASAAESPNRHIVVFPFGLEGALESEMGLTAASVLVGYLEQEGSSASPIDGAGFTESNLGDARARALEAAATDLVLGKLTRLGGKVVVQVKLYQASSSSSEAVQSEMLTADSVEDLAPVLLRVARTLSGNPSSADIYSVTPEEAPPLRREESHRSVGFALGGAVFTSEGPEGVLGGAGAYWLYDARWTLFDLGAHLFGGSGGVHGGLDIGLMLPLLTERITPYVGAGLSLAGTSNKSASGGMGFFGSAGVFLGRTADVHFRVDLRYFRSAYELEGTSIDAIIFSLGIGK